MRAGRPENSPVRARCWKERLEIWAVFLAPNTICACAQLPPCEIFSFAQRDYERAGATQRELLEQQIRRLGTIIRRRSPRAPVLGRYCWSTW
jgi:hypothetical protein